MEMEGGWGGKRMEQNHGTTSRKLDFNAPLLSTRRLSNPNPPTSLQISCHALQPSSDRFPFSWEQAAGKPKDLDAGDPDHHHLHTPPPKLPAPSWWRPIQDHDNESYDDGFDGDIDIDIDDNDEVFSDAVDMDVASLSEAMDIVEKSRRKEKLGESGTDGLKLKLAAEYGREVTPNFIIQRFLPDAKALAAASSVSVSGGRAAVQSYSPPRGCGLQEVLFPWRFRHKLCGVKTPVRHASSSSSVSVQQQHHQHHKNKLLLRKH